jgi:1,4-alpha-glucan branching enzyme
LIDDNEQERSSEHDIANPTDTNEETKTARRRAPQKTVPSTEAAAEGIEASVAPEANAETEPPKRRAPRKKATDETTRTASVSKARAPRTTAKYSFEKAIDDVASPIAGDLTTSVPSEHAIPEALPMPATTEISQRVPTGGSLLTAGDAYLFNEGNHYRLYQKLGSHPMEGGTSFAVWAPNAERVSVVGDFNGWNAESNPMRATGDSGIWEAFIPDLGQGSIYKYRIVSRNQGYTVDKADPFAVHAETPPKTGSIVWPLDYEWNDSDWMQNRRWRNAPDAPISIYEVHLGSWMRVPEENNRSLNYREIAHRLAGHVTYLGFTHVEFLPVAEHPFYGSWGYQATGMFAPTSRYGTPQDFMYLVDVLHQHGIGVILDWVPSHFATDEHGLTYFDGTHLFEHADPRQGYHPDWGSYIFNYGRNEVRSFLLSSAMYWLDTYHIDGLRVDAVASMLYLDYSRKAGEWIPNQFGGRENLDAINFLRQFNTAVYGEYPDVQTIAEESTAWPMVSRPVYVGGLGFGMKWDMGWMHDTLKYFAIDPIHRRYHHNYLTFRMLYAFNENFVLPLSHDEVVHLKGSLSGKMAGDDWQKFANLRSLYGYMYAQSGKKLLFMGAEIGQWSEWNHESSLEWHLLQREPHAGLQRWLVALNHLYRHEPAMHELDFDPAGFSWLDANDSENSVIGLSRCGRSSDDDIIAVFNFTPVPRHSYRVGVPRGGYWAELLNSDAVEYGGSGMGNMGGVEAVPVEWHGRPYSITVTLPPLSATFFKAGGWK